MDGNSLKLEVVCAGGEGYVERGCPEECLKDVAGWFRPAGSSQMGLGAPEENASATTSLIRKYAESICVPEKTCVQ